ncbi:hypothetical protein [Sphingomonas sp.]|uniref:hypothetical protein n=1 Tax=Sphingomonas sp. TaxID=28214 RepID=UPI0035667541
MRFILGPAAPYIMGVLATLFLGMATATWHLNGTLTSERKDHAVAVRDNQTCAGTVKELQSTVNDQNASIENLRAVAATQQVGRDQSAKQILNAKPRQMEAKGAQQMNEWYRGLTQ